MLNWDDLRIALAIGRAGSLTRAAAMLGVNQSTATRRLVALEATLGTTLFVRTAAGLVPTEAGEAAIARATEIEVRIDRLRNHVTAGSRAPSGPVRLRGEPWVLDRLAATAMRGFLDAFPDIDLRLETGVGPDGLRRGETVSLWFDREPRDLEFGVKLGPVPHAVYGSAAAASPGWVSFLDDDGLRPAPARVVERLRREDEALRVATTDPRIMVSAVASGLGRALVPVCLAREDARLVRVGCGPHELDRMLVMHLHPDTVQAAKVQMVVRWLRQSFESAFAAADIASAAA